MYRETPGDFGPAFVSDLRVAARVQAGQVLVHLQEVDRKSMVSGAANRGQNIFKRSVDETFVGRCVH